MTEPFSASQQREIRNAFPLLSHTTYLNSCSCGVLSQKVAAAITEGFLASWGRYGGRAWYSDDGWLESIEQVRVKCARLIGAQPQEVAIAPSVSDALARIASALEYGKRQKVVVSTMDFPTLSYQWLVKEHQGVACHFVESPDAIGVPAELFASKVDRKTALVATSHVCYRSGYIQDIRAVADIAHAHGAFLLVDDYQATGQVPVNVVDQDIDFLVSGTLKWLLGGPGLAFIYIREGLISTLKQTMAGWFGHQDQLAFHSRAWVPRPNAARFEMGTPAIGALYAASAALDLILDRGVDRIQSVNASLMEYLLERSQLAGLNIQLPEPGHRSAIACIKLSSAFHAAHVVKYLADQHIIVDHRGQMLRVSPHFYNTFADIDTLLNALKDALET